MTQQAKQIFPETPVFEFQRLMSQTHSAFSRLNEQYLSVRNSE